jgi:AraC-like DNA-binding protein
MAAEPSLAVLMLDQLGFTPWQYGLAFAIPCAGGLVGSRLARPLVARFGTRAVLRVAGTVRACWPVGLAFVGAGTGGLALVVAVELGLIVSISLFNPVMATYRLQHVPDDRIARTLTAWSISSSLTIAALTATWGLLAALTSPRAAIAAAGLLLLATPLLLPRRARLASPPSDNGARASAAVSVGCGRIFLVAVRETEDKHLSDLVWLRRVRDRIDREYAQPLDVEALARGAHMSSGHLSRQFRAAYGESPYNYLMTRRIERAMALLRRGDMSVTEVCFAVGSSSLGTFSTRFTELVGVPPSVYREQAVGEMAGIPPCVAKRVTKPIRNREAPAASRS